MKSKFYFIIAILLSFFLIGLNSCRKWNDPCLCSPVEINRPGLIIRSADLSALSEVQSHSNQFYDLGGSSKSPLEILTSKGLNTVRLRLWHNPSSGNSGFEDVKQQAQFLKSQGMKIWLSVHYSDSWADPGQQVIPTAWQGLSYSVLRDSIFQYTNKIMREINPYIIQIGNEINTGFLHPHGNLQQNESQFLDLLATAESSIKAINPETKIVLHYAGIQGATWFFDKVKYLNYDYIGLSYYPWWHGKRLTELDSTITLLGENFNKQILIAETAYPFTLDWNDQTNNIVGDSTQLILPDYPATKNGQFNFMNDLKNKLFGNIYAKGISYWGGEMIAFDGPQSSSGSPWENCALFDFNNKALPAINYLH